VTSSKMTTVGWLVGGVCVFLVVDADVCDFVQK